MGRCLRAFTTSEIHFENELCCVALLHLIRVKSCHKKCTYSTEDSAGCKHSTVCRHCPLWYSQLQHRLYSDGTQSILSHMKVLLYMTR